MYAGIAKMAITISDIIARDIWRQDVNLKSAAGRKERIRKTCCIGNWNLLSIADSSMSRIEKEEYEYENTSFNM